MHGIIGQIFLPSLVITLLFTWHVARLTTSQLKFAIAYLSPKSSTSVLYALTGPHFKHFSAKHFRRGVIDMDFRPTRTTLIYGDS